MLQAETQHTASTPDQPHCGHCGCPIKPDEMRDRCRQCDSQIHCLCVHDPCRAAASDEERYSLTPAGEELLSEQERPLVSTGDGVYRRDFSDEDCTDMFTVVSWFLSLIVIALAVWTLIEMILH